MHNNSRRPRLQAALLHRPRGQWVKHWSAYYGEHSPIDGHARAVLAGLPLLARPWATRHGAGPSLIELDLPPRDRFEALDLPAEVQFRGVDPIVFAGSEAAIMNAAAACRWFDRKPITLTEIVRYVGLKRSHTASGLEQLCDVGELWISRDGAYVLSNYWNSQETPSARSHRARRAVDSQQDSQRDAAADSPVDSPVESHGPNRGRGRIRDPEPPPSGATLPAIPRVTVFPGQSGGRDRADRRMPDLLVTGLPPELEQRLIERPVPGIERVVELWPAEQLEPDPLEWADLPDPHSGSQALEPHVEYELEQRLEPEHVAHRWLGSVVFAITTQPAPHPGGKWKAAYMFIGQQPESDRERVGKSLALELRSGRLKARMCSPQHVADYWSAYLSDEPPRSSPPSAAPHTPMASADERALDVESNPDWLTEVTK